MRRNVAVQHLICRSLLYECLEYYPKTPGQIATRSSMFMNDLFLLPTRHLYHITDNSRCTNRYHRRRNQPLNSGQRTSLVHQTTLSNRNAPPIMDKWAGLLWAELAIAAEPFSATHARAADTDREKSRYTIRVLRCYR